MQALLTNIELDIQELKCLMDAYSREPNASLREVLKRNIFQMRGRLDQLLLELDTVMMPQLSEEIPVSFRADVETEERTVDEPMEEDENDVESPLQTEIQIKETIQVASAPILGERIRPVADLRRSISLNDSFRFSRELFSGEMEQMNRAIEQISQMSSLDAATAFLFSKVNVSEENEALADLMELLKKYFN